MNKFYSVLVIVLMSLALISCGGSATPSATSVPATDQPVMTEASMPMATEVVSETAPAPTESGPAPLEGDVMVDIVGTKFTPSLVTIRVGATVTWTNKSGDEHTVTSDDGLFNSSLNGGDTFTFTFTEAGEFPFHCEIHRGMKGKIVVVE